MTRLSVNVNKVAHLRNTRHLNIPSVVHASQLCIDAGAEGITVHPRPDERHIRPGDVRDLAQLLKKYPDVEYNIEGNPLLPPFMELVRAAKPHQCTLVPDGPDVFTSDEGWQMSDEDCRNLEPIVAELVSLGCRVCLFCGQEADRALLQRIVDLGAQRVELYTEPYAAAFGTPQLEAVHDRFATVARTAQELGLGVNAGHDLNLENLAQFLTIPDILEVSIGHALIGDALEFGLPRTVELYLAITTAA